MYHQGAVWGAFVTPVLTYFAVHQQMGFATPMLYATVGSLIVYVIDGPLSGFISNGRQKITG